MLIKLAAPKPKNRFGHFAEAMDPNAASPLEPGRPPPWISPHCRSCGLPVEWFTIDWVASPFFLPIQWGCCGKTSGTKIPASEVLYKNRHGGAIWVNEPRRSVHGKR